MAPPRTVFATPTVKLSIADLASCTYRPEKCMAIAASPAALAAGAGPRIVLRAAPATNKETADLVSGFFVKLGFKPTVERGSV
jgi:3-hydroxybutyryl-CoA dehydrogenase